MNFIGNTMFNLLYFFIRKKIFVYIFYFSGTILFFTLAYHTVNQIHQSSNLIQSTIILLSNVSFNNNNENKSQCIDNSNQRHESLSNLIRTNDIINYVGFILRSHSLFYCSVPKVATRTLLTFITYLHIRDDLIPLTQNRSILKQNLIDESKFYKIDYFNEIISSSSQNNSKKLTANSLYTLSTFLPNLIITNNTKSSKIDIWSMYQKKALPYIRLRSLSNPSILFSSNFTRVIFVRHPLERLASAYVDKITSLNSIPFTTYDSLRRAICRHYSSVYLTNDQRISYRMNRRLSKRIDEPCQNIIPSFEHFIEYILSDSFRDDVHWQPYSKLCRACSFKYNFIGKYETINEDLKKLIKFLGLESNDWIDENYFKTGKTKENYKLMYSSLSNESICQLKHFYEYDFKLFNYRFEDYLINQTNIQCHFSTRKKYLKKKLSRKTNSFH